eukprot:537209-Heterocapsa_arctica.AAC.1
MIGADIHMPSGFSVNHEIGNVLLVNVFSRVLKVRVDGAKNQTLLPHLGGPIFKGGGDVEVLVVLA